MIFRQKRHVRVHLQDGPTIEGVMEGRTRHTYVLWAPKVLTGETEHPQADLSGIVEIPRERVLFFQIVG